ncbi:P-loop containing nucleoside triphosphate hydrolase protein [Hypoxylon rubiginosum]|uniref:P-loop containing nucleoside triphosphate hydrolase protein n=1 Tax=Hypoxylon rubiginosum TaxID=110542 RepID=A0ACC0CKK0_9PEZI|nr:P-loop containing nucleoside triphosphate hydrolase protein [Hypoxylon rubiginosum]
MAFFSTFTPLIPSSSHPSFFSLSNTGLYSQIISLRDNAVMAQHHPPNLDHVVARVRHGDRLVDFTLNTFLSNPGRAAAVRLSSDYDYEGIRKYLEDQIHLPLTQPLVFNEPRKVRTKHDLERLIIDIQMGTTTLPFLDESKVPALILRSESSAGSSETEKGCEACDNDSHTMRQPTEHAEQSPKCEKSSTNVIELSDDDDDDDGPANDIIDLNQAPEKELPDALVSLDKNLERETWEFACAFSGHDPAKTDGSNPEHHHRFQGLRVAVKPHQLWAITRILFMYYFEKTFGVLLADGMGVGKTLEGSCGAILTPHIRLAAQQVRRDRKHGLGRHLPAGTSGKPQPRDSECPLGTYIRGFACPCVERLPTAQLVASRTLPKGPAVLLVPPGLREQWYEQLCKYISPEPLPDDIRKTEIWSVHTAAESITSAVKSKYKRVKFVTARELQDDDVTDDRWAWGQDPGHSQQAVLRLGGRKNDNSHIIMIMPTSSALSRIQKTSTLPVEYEEREILEPFFVKPSWIVMDEAHNQITEDTVVWRFITEKLMRRSASPTYLVCMSGTPIRRSPLALKPFFAAVTSSTARSWKEPPSYNPWDHFNAWVKESDWLVNHKGDAESTDKQKRNVYEERFSRCKLLGKKVLRPYMIQRHSHYLFFGSPIVPLPAMDVETRAFSGFPADYLEDIRSLVNMSKEQMEKRLQRKVNLWRAENRRGSRPTIEDVISEIGRGFGNQGRFYDLGLCATFPALAPMLLREKPLRFRIGGVKSNLNAMSDADLRSHVLWPYLRAIRRGSEKMDFIQQTIRDMRRDDERHRDVGDDRQVLRKKMIIFTVSPMTALLIALILRKELPGVRQALVLASDAPAKRGSLYAPFCRMTDEEIPDDRDPNDPLILITTAGVSAEGFNMTRANYAIMAEPAFAKQVEAQAFHRVHRHGQQATTHLFSLYSSWNPVEVIIRSRQDVRAKLLDEAIWALPAATSSS